MSIRIDDVRAFWNANPCQSDLSKQQERKKYFEEIAHKRYHGREWHIPIVAKFAEFKNKDVLEIGCGVGTDGFEFAKNGATYTGIDLTPNSIILDLYSERSKCLLGRSEEIIFFCKKFQSYIAFAFFVIFIKKISSRIDPGAFLLLRLI